LQLANLENYLAKAKFTQPKLPNFLAYQFDNAVDSSPKMD